MAKLTILYGHPDDAEAFEDYYFNRHLPFAQQMPNVRQAELTKVVGTLDGAESPYYRVAEMWYANLDELHAALHSDDGHAVVADLPNFAPAGTTVLISEAD